MPTILYREFTGGLDARKLPETSRGGVLLRGTDGHINRGGEFEKRADIVQAYALPAGTVGLANTPTSLVVFGSGAAPAGLPTGVAYQRLQHPSGQAMARLLSYDLFAGKVYAIAEYTDGSIHHFYDGTRVPSWFDGRSRAQFAITGGVAGASVTSITVGGVEVLGSAIAWTNHPSAAQLATAIAAQITTQVSNPDYTATAVDNSVVIAAAVAGPTANGLQVVVTVSGAITFTPANGSIVMAGGQTAPGGTFQVGSFVRTVGDKAYSVSGPLLHFSGIKDPTKWTSQTVGAGFIDLSTQASGSETLTSIVRYYDFIAVFAGRTIQVWFVDPDPANNRIRQTLNNTGTASPRSVVQFGDSDVFYLDDSGVRSLKARDSSNAAFTSDIGSPIDPLILADLETVGRDEPIAVMEPRDGRLWVAVRRTIYVFSYFSGSKISAWTTYAVPFDIEDMIVFGRKVWLRSGDTVYVYGGLGATLEYDDPSVEAEGWLPYLDGDRPGQKKMFQGLDVACTGTWEIRAALEPANSAASDLVGTVSHTTFNGPRIPFQVQATHVSLRFRSKGPGPAVLGSVALHYEGSEEGQK